MGTLGGAMTISSERACGVHRGAARRLLRLLALTLAVIMVCLANAAWADSEDLETEVKAAMLYKFLGYIEWPDSAFASPDSPYVIAVLDADDIAEALQRVTAERTVNERAIKVETVEDIEQIGDAHLLFIGRSARVNQKRLDKLARQHSVATVTESQRGLQPSSVINLRVVNGRVRFDVSLAATETHNLKMSARMLSVATTVEKEAR